MSVSLLRTREWRALLDAVDRLYLPVEPGDFPAHLFAVLAALLPGTVSSLDSVDQATGRTESHIAPDAVAPGKHASVQEAVVQFLWQHPLLPHIGKDPGLVAQTTDCVSQRQFRRTDLYHHVFRPVEIEYQIVGGLAWPGRQAGFTVNRDRTREFSAREVELVRQLRPHVERAYAAVRRLDLLRQRLEAQTAARVPTVGAHARWLARGLTGREVEVLHWIAEGKRDGEIAVILGISARTVNRHAGHVFAKLGVETRTAAAAVFLRLGA